MAITATATSEYIISDASINMGDGRIVAHLRWLVNGQNCGTIEVVLTGADVAAALGAQPNTGMTRGDDLARMIYEFAISSKLVSGQIG